MKNAFNLQRDSVRIREVNIKDNRKNFHLQHDEKKNREMFCIEKEKLADKYTNIQRPSMEICHLREILKGRQIRHVGKGDERLDYTDVYISVDMRELFYYCDKIMRRVREAERRDNGKGPGAVSREKAEDYRKILDRLYSDGFYVVDPKEGKKEHYVEYKRSANSAKKGKHLFILERYYKPMLEWTWMGKPMRKREKCNLTDAKAYETLVCSNLIGTVQIDPGQVLVVGDIKHNIQEGLSREEQEKYATCVEEVRELVTRKGDRYLYASKETDSAAENMVFDGEALLDESIFQENECEEKGMMLLRNFFFKSCAFQTRIQEYYKDYFYRKYPNGDYETFQITDYFGNKIYAKDVRLITTPSSMKVLKFYAHYGDKKAGVMEQKAQTFEVWKNAVRANGNVFGVVKHEHEPRNLRRFTYQMINSIPFTREDISSLLQKEFEFLQTLRNDTEKYIRYVGGGKDYGKMYLSTTDDFILSMYRLNHKFAETKMFKAKRYRDVYAYVDRLKQGKVRIEADYYTMCSMPFELLRWSLGEEIPTSLLKPWEVCHQGTEEGTRLTLCRNPHICSGNVEMAVNRKPEELERWFCFGDSRHSKNILVLSPWNWDVMNALNGADFDSDEVLCIREKIITNRTREIMADHKRMFPVPHNCVQGREVAPCSYYDREKLVELDSKLSANMIGKIVNLAQVINSIYFDNWNRIEEQYGYIMDDFGELENAYENVALLAVLSGIEIDKAKHEFDLDIARQYELLLRERAGVAIWKLGEMEEQHGVSEANNIQIMYPYFMRNIQGKDKGRTGNYSNSEGDHSEYVLFQSPMEYLYQEVDQKYKEISRDMKNTISRRTVTIDEIFDMSIDRENEKSDSRRVQKVLELLTKLIPPLDHINIKMTRSNMDWEEFADQKKAMEEDAVYELTKSNRAEKLTTADMKKILLEIFHGSRGIEKKGAVTKEIVLDQIKKENRQMEVFVQILAEQKEASLSLLEKLEEAYYPAFADLKSMISALEASVAPGDDYELWQDIYSQRMASPYFDDKLQDLFQEDSVKDSDGNNMVINNGQIEKMLQTGKYYKYKVNEATLQKLLRLVLEEKKYIWNHPLQAVKLLYMSFPKQFVECVKKC